MEIIAVILFIVLMFATAGDKKKKKGNAAAKPGTPAMPARRTGPRTIVKRLDDAMEALDRQIEQAQTKAPAHSEPVVQALNRAAQGKSMLADAECAGGSMEHTHAEGHSALEDEDCHGGSMEHTHTEGVSRAIHARRMAVIDAAEDTEALPETIDARALRRAVVMAEVLGKPRSMRKF